MKRQSRIFLFSLALGLSCTQALAQEDELDITIRVLSEDEDASAFVQRIELPPPGEINASATSTTDLQEDSVVDAVQDITEVSDESTNTAINAALDNISINGARGSDNAATGTLEDVPAQIVDVLDENLPLNDDLTDTVDDTTGEIVDVLGQTLDDVADPGTDVTDTIGDNAGDVADSVEDGVDDVTDGLDDELGDAAENVDDAAEDITGNVDDSLDDVSDAVAEDSGDIVNTVEDDLGDAGNVGEGIEDAISDSTDAQDALELPETEALGADALEIPEAINPAL